MRASSWRGVLVAGLCGVACSGSLRFDDYTLIPDAGSGRDQAASESAVDQTNDRASSDASDAAIVCTDANCRFLTDDCPGPECEMLCPEGGRCVGTCGDSCAVNCQQRSLCTLSAGKNGAIKCEQDATCELTVAAATIVECWSRSRCDVNCTGPCVVECTNTAKCRLSCAGATPATVTGRATCT